MDKVTRRNLKPGMVVAKEILTKQGQSIAKEGTVLSSQLIAKLSFYKIDEVYVEERMPDTMEAPPKEVELSEVKEPVEKKAVPKEERIAYSEKLKTTPEYQEFSLNYSRNIANLKSAFRQILAGDGENINKDDMLREAEKLFSSRTSLDLFDMLHNMRTLDDSVYAHSVNVALFSRAIGKWLKWPKDELNNLTLAGLLHDIGKAKISEEVLNKTGKLTDEEFELIRKHPRYGYDMLRKVNGIGHRIMDAALKHHERFDGSGYPDHLKGEDIDDYSAIIAIADVYDAMTATRVYRAPKSAFQVIAEFESDGYNKYNTKFILTFLQNMASAYQNNRVILSDGASARIIYINQSKLSKPMVQLDDGSVIDLSRQSALEIVKCL